MNVTVSNINKWLTKNFYLRKRLPLNYQSMKFVFGNWRRTVQIITLTQPEKIFFKKSRRGFRNPVVLKMKNFVRINNALKPLNMVTMSSILDVIDIQFLLFYNFLKPGSHFQWKRPMRSTLNIEKARYFYLIVFIKRK